jgi:hypothetical protein
MQINAQQLLINGSPLILADLIDLIPLFGSQVEEVRTTHGMRLHGGLWPK